MFGENLDGDVTVEAGVAGTIYLTQRIITNCGSFRRISLF
jgi:hypothetical protein